MASSKKATNEALCVLDVSESAFRRYNMHPCMRPFVPSLPFFFQTGQVRQCLQPPGRCDHFLSTYIGSHVHCENWQQARDFALAPSAGLTKTGFVQLSTGALNHFLYSQSADYRRHCRVFEHNYRTLRKSGDYRLVWDWAGEVVAGNYPDTPSQTTTEPPSKRSRIRIAAAPKWFAGSVETDGVSVHALFVSPNPQNDSNPNNEGDRKKLGAQKADEEGNPLRCVQSGVSPIHSSFTNRSHNGIQAPKIFDTPSCLTNIYRIHSVTHGTRHTCRHHCLMVCSTRFRARRMCPLQAWTRMATLPRRGSPWRRTRSCRVDVLRRFGVVLGGIYGEDGAKK